MKWVLRVSRRLVIAGALFNVTLGLVSCGGGGGSAGPSDPKGQPTPAIEVSIYPKTASIGAYGSQVQFTASVTGSSNTEVEWQIAEPLSVGNIVGGLFTPFAIGTFEIVVTSKADPSKYDIATVTVDGPNYSRSYSQYKGSRVQPSELPQEALYAHARAFGDFLGRGSIDLVLANVTYQGMPIDAATDASLQVWKRQEDDSWVQDTSVLPDVVGCLHPRKMLVSDFNIDGTPDIFVACHGYNTAPYPGERNRLILSTPDGFSVVDAGADVGYFHAAATEDVNRDGYPDVLVVDRSDATSALHFLLNNRDGTFYKDYSLLPNDLGSRDIISVELVDVDGDGWTDILAGGNEWGNQGDGMVFINPGSFDFSEVNPIVLPAVANEGTILDFTVTQESDGQRLIWVNRTSDGDVSQYESLTVQKITWPQLDSEVVYSERPGNWRPWLIPAVIDGVPVITTDNTADGLIIHR